MNIGSFEMDSFFFKIVIVPCAFDDEEDALVVSRLDKRILSIPLFCPPKAERTMLTSERCFVTTTPGVFMEFADPHTSLVSCLYFIIDNNRIAFNDTDFDTSPLYEPRLNDFPEHPRYTPLRLSIPLHPYDTAYEDVPLQYIPQRIPLWYAQREDTELYTSGSDAGKWSCGYWVLEKDNEQDNPLRRLSLTRYGRLKEPETTLVCLHNFINCLFFECGTYKDTEKRIKASPDLLCKDMRTGEWSVFELKASYRSTKFPDYYIPQLYWEMMATNTRKATLVRYQSKRAATVQNKWGKFRKAFAYTIEYNAKVAEMLLDNVRFARQHLQGKSLAEVVSAFPKRFQQAQQVCAGIAAQTLGKELDIPTDELDRYENFRRNLLSVIKKTV